MRGVGSRRWLGGTHAAGLGGEDAAGNVDRAAASRVRWVLSPDLSLDARMLRRPTRLLSRRLLVPALLGCLAAACGSGPDQAGGTSPSTAASTSADATTGNSAAPSPSASATPARVSELPRGGTTVFPDNLVVMHYGTAGTGALGVLGDGTPEQAADRLEKAAAPFAAASGRPVLPAFELITTVASSKPGKDGRYSSMLAPSQVQHYLDVARAHRMLVVLDFQPGRAEFLEQVQQYEQFLLQPDVGVALDPEWKLTPAQRPLKQIGTSAAAPINAVSAYVSQLVATHHLPEKIFMVHQFKSYQLPDRALIADAPGLATVLHVDGFGTEPDKLQTYGVLASRTSQFVNGFKLFYKADIGLMTPAQAMALQPRPELISYQ